MFVVPSRSEAKAIFLPSGDQAGYEFSDLSLVRLRAASPLASTRKISALPSRLETINSPGFSSRGGGAGAAHSDAAAQPATSPIKKRLMSDTSSKGSPRTAS